MAKAKCPKKEKKSLTKPTITSQEVIWSWAIKVIFTDNVQLWNNVYKKGTVAQFDDISNIKRFCTVVK